MSTTQQLNDLLKNADKNETFLIGNGENRIPVRFKRGAANAAALIVNFHGAIDKKTRKVPAFIPWLPVPPASAHQISIADPIIEGHEDLSIAWYAGSEHFDLQAQLHEMLDEFSDLLGVSRTIFFGTSGGGFAALFNAWKAESDSSIAIVGNPQTNILNYYKGHVDRYQACCWPSSSDAEGISESICHDVAELFSKAFTKTVIYIQSTADTFHMSNHMTPFLQKTAGVKGDRLILDVGFWGGFRHAPEMRAYLPWIRAALTSKTTSKKDILIAKASLQHEVSGGEVGKTSPEKNSKNFEEKDLAFAKVISDWMLKTVDTGKVIS
ncbi:hypothetical protein EKE94_01255 [Mesobaculum littorinae]|uniref:Alpha/beta hydrolase n=1 Tax=Mesobaculum littorinae TaxID=2486419 RepID=A0A438AL07_9RHOB|nr:hypothetical protein [Mesobaculum littorinae]RVV99350.1 hypothetical protein EKE94_01255 [Mesobaculum littorinae]